jgi:5-(carboxyamino)imidazole ribonucleotide synthase
MFTAAASRMGYRVAVWDPDPDAPAHRVAAHSFPTPFHDPQTLGEFSRLVSVATYEWENVPAETCRRLERLMPVRPSSMILEVIQDRLEQKAFLAAQGCPVPPFVALKAPDQLNEAIEQVGYPAVCKTATAGYDGKGQWTIRRESDLPGVRQALQESGRQRIRWIVESFVSFERELSVLVVRSLDGRSVAYPVAENQHETGILRATTVPAAIPASVSRSAGELALRVVERLDGVGVFCLELFQMPGDELLINEIAPRPHNSGHYTLDACSVSQFEQQVRAVCGLPLGEVRLFGPAVMVNLIGDDVSTVMSAEGCRALLTIPGAALHLYGKRQIRARRKMGHVTFLAGDAMTARDRANQLRAALASRSVV